MLSPLVSSRSDNEKRLESNIKLPQRPIRTKYEIKVQTMQLEFILILNHNIIETETGEVNQRTGKET